jgi:hypothetical protein
MHRFEVKMFFLFGSSCISIIKQFAEKVLVKSSNTSTGEPKGFYLLRRTTLPRTSNAIIDKKLFLV